MGPHNRLEKQIIELQNLLTSLQNAHSYLEKVTILDALPIVQDFLNHAEPVQNFLKNLTEEATYAIKSVIALGQGPVIFNLQAMNSEHFEFLVQLLEQLLEIEIFYQHLGGIIGYHFTVISLIVSQQKPTHPLFDHIRYIHPEGLHITSDTPETREVVRHGIENIKNIAAIYPLGGAGDRLNLKDDNTGEPLPAACLPFLGYTLMEGLIRDLQALEYLSFKMFGKRPLTPIAIMTSVEKNNHLHILKICKSCQWFGRPPESFYFFIQPLVPVITCEGYWSLSAPLTLALKPCGHGVLWKLAEEQGVFAWLESKKRHQCLIRQINNPVAGTDNSILALMGSGCRDRKAFGFVSCERLLNSAEGTNVLIEKRKENGYDYCITNIEYTEFDQKGIGEFPAKPGSPYSIYPANTNILFADIPSVRKVLKVCPIPGQLINMKSKVPYIDPEGNLSYVPGGRLESTMQNIADYIVDHFPQQLPQKDYQHALKTFIIYNTRSKTISTTKKTYQPGESPVSTPEQACYDLLSNHYELLRTCGFELPEWKSLEDFLHRGPSCFFIFHPGLGPLYSIIAQKIRKGRLAQSAELQLEIAEVDIEDLSLTGSLLITAQSPLGTYDRSGVLQYGQESRCTLKRVTIHNEGIDPNCIQHYWKNDITRCEAVKIILGERAEFHAEGVILKGSHHFEVPADHLLTLKPLANGEWTQELVPIQSPTWYWHYEFDSQNAIRLKKLDILRN